MEDWDLQAIVRGSTSEIQNNMMNSQPSCFDHLSMIEDDFSHILPDFFGSSRANFDELEGLYKPFYPVFEPFSSQTILTSSISVPMEAKEQEKVQQKSHPTAAKSKTSKKNQQNRVVKQVTANDVCSDMWAWRKYGQKPIKGSPYPRSYYRCSSSKGCSARKQVERSQSDPDIFTITYTAEHNHGLPTRRNSLAGSTRNKFPRPKNNDSPSFNKNLLLSPTSPSVTSNEEEDLNNANIKREEQEQEEEQVMGDDIFLPQIIVSEDFFPSIEELLFG